MRHSVLALALTIVVSCGSSGSSNPKPDASASDAGTTCPATAPAEGSPCPTALSFTCEYGSMRSPECNLRMMCTGTSWQKLENRCSYGLQVGCPSTPPPEGQACGTPVRCLYTNEDDACSCTGVWHCASKAKPTEAQCPTIRPRQGTPCASPQLTCDYGCVVSPELNLICTPRGIWESEDCILNPGG